MQRDTNETIDQFFARIVKASRERRTPSERNRRIADEVRVNGRTQADVGAEFGLSQRRVSQICQQVDRWYAATEAWEREETCGSGERRCEREWQKRQLTEIYRRAMRSHARSEQPLITRRRRTRGGEEEWQEETERHERQDTGSLRVALRAMEQRAKLDARPEPSMGNTMRQSEMYLHWVFQALDRFRSEAERRGEVPRSAEGSRAMVERMIRELLGSTPDGATRPPERAPLAATQPGPAEAPAEDGANGEIGLGDMPGEIAAQSEAPAHPIGSSSTSAPSELEAGAVEPAEADTSAGSDAAATSYDAAAETAVAASAHEEPARRSRTRRSAAERDHQSPESVLSDLSKAFGLGMSWEQADRELDEFLVNDYGRQPRWSYSAEQRTALLAWYGITRQRCYGRQSTARHAAHDAS